MTPRLSLQALSKVFPGDDLPVLDSVSLDVLDGEFLCVLGPSGCGKTTLLRMLAGLLEPTSGRIRRRDEDGGRPFSGMVFQDLALFPWKTVRENVELGPLLQRKPPAAVREAADRCLRLTHLAGCADAYPHLLSGGMRQRVALARAFASDPQVFLLDEPLGALDAALRRLLQAELAQLCAAQKKTFVFVTHSIEEALFLADRVVLLTARPARIKRVFDVPFPRPRAPEIRETAAFSALTGEVWAALKTEIREPREEERP
jgi:NitT/TauT family transport system ATP-binding protein